MAETGGLGGPEPESKFPDILPDEPKKSDLIQQAQDLLRSPRRSPEELKSIAQQLREHAAKLRDEARAVRAGAGDILTDVSKGRSKEEVKEIKKLLRQFHSVNKKADQLEGRPPEVDRAEKLVVEMLSGESIDLDTVRAAITEARNAVTAQKGGATRTVNGWMETLGLPKISRRTISHARAPDLMRKAIGRARSDSTQRRSGKIQNLILKLWGEREIVSVQKAGGDFAYEQVTGKGPLAGRHFLSLSREGEAPLLEIDKKLGEGSSGIVFKVTSLTTKQVEAIKFSPQEAMQREAAIRARITDTGGIQEERKYYAHGSLNDGLQVLRLCNLLNIAPTELAQKKPQELEAAIRGIQDNPTLQEIALGLLGQSAIKNEASLAAAIPDLVKKCLGAHIPSHKELFRMGGDIVEGLLHIGKARVVLGDIKPENMLWDKHGAVLADLEGASFWEGEHTSPLALSIQYAAENCYEMAKKYQKAGDEENWFRAGRAHDIHCTGRALVQMNTGSFPPKGKDAAYYEHYLQERCPTCPSGARKIIAKMCVEPKFDIKNPPTTFPLQVTEAELQELRSILRF